MNPLLSVLVQLGIIDAATADRLNAQFDPDQARAYAEQQLTTAFTGGLQGQYERVMQFVARNPQATQAQWDAFWTQENAALWASVGPTLTQLASDGAIVATVVLGDGRQWQNINQRLVDWTRTYYAQGDQYGSMLQLNQTSRQQVADAVIAWQQGELSSRLGLPSLALELQPTFGRDRAEVIATTEYTRIGTEAKRAEAETDEDIDYVRFMTAVDDRVCPICGPVHGQVIAKNAAGFVHPTLGMVGFPPLHSRCRCDLAFETKLTREVPLRDNYTYTGALPDPNAPTPPARRRAS